MRERQRSLLREPLVWAAIPVLLLVLLAAIAPGLAAPAEMPVRARPAAVDTRIRYSAGRYPEIALPGGAARAVRSLIRAERPLRYGEYRWDEAGVPAGPVWVRVDLARQILSVFRGHDEIGATVVLYGGDGKPTPTGAFPVLAKARHYRSRQYDAPMPYSLRLTEDGVAIHASDVRADAATHGCIGVPEDFARRLFAAMKLGDPVYILQAG